MRKLFSVIFLCAVLAALLSSCGSTSLEAVSADLDFSASAYKHINNGGVTDDETLPYNVDAITGATMTVEGPAVVTSIPLSVREIENNDAGIVRGLYKDSTGVKTYEGLDLYYLLHNMVEGDNGIVLTDTAYQVSLKNSNRETILTITLAQIEEAHNIGRPVILAYGVGSKDGSTVAPFVFDAANDSGSQHSLGYVEKLDNEDGCIKLVLDADSYGFKDYDTFSNVAYVYVEEENTPGFKHSLCDEESYGASRYTDYITTFRGSALGHEIDLTVEELESLVTYDENGEVAEGGIGYSDWYSLANNAYWYVNEYEGLDLYKLLIYLGMDDADTMGRKLSRTTLVKFIASDGVASSETFSVETLSYPEGFGFYKKNATDPGDGSYAPTNADLVKLGYPVLLCYGVNSYPYTISKTDDAYVSGLSNAGGPLRVVFGKTQYNHPNGSNQVQQASEIIVGEDILYNTHKYTDDADLNAAASNTVSVVVNSASGDKILNTNITVGDIEDIIYADSVSAENKKNAKVKEHYTAEGSTDIYEGVDMTYFLMNYLGIPGTNGTVTFSNDEGLSVTVSLEDIMKDGYNTELNRSGIPSILAFAKNGSPMVESESSNGYIKSIALNPYLDTDPVSYDVDNQGGPLMLLVPSAADGTGSLTLCNVSSIEVDLIPDSYAHTDKTYAKEAKQTIKFYGPGLEREYTYTVSDIESKQTVVKTLDYSMLNKSGSASQVRYRGIAIYELFKEIGINNNAGDVTVYCSDGSSCTYSLMLLKKSYPNYLDSSKDDVFAMLVYGVGDIEADKTQGTPLTAETGGPIMLAVPQEEADSVNKSLCLKNVVSVYVDANEITTWGHAMSDVYSEFLESTFTLTIKNDAYEWTHDFTVAELEAMEDIIVRDDYTVLDLGTCEGLDLWKLYKKYAKDVAGYDSPVSFTAYANDGYKNDLLSNIYMTGLVDGVADENGNTKKVILCYAINGYPCVDDESHEGYTGLAGNVSGPLRVVVENFQGGSIKYCNKLVVTLTGTDPINIDID